MKVLVIGSQGYIGSALCPFLRTEDHELTTIDAGWFSDGHPKGSYANLDQDLILKFDAIVLLAGISSVQQAANIGAAATFDHNVAPFVKLLDLMSPDQPLIYASSASVYGKCGDKAACEGRGFATAINAYDMSKQMIDMYAAESKKLAIGLRFGTVNGYSSNPRIDLMIQAMFYSAKSRSAITVVNKNSHRALLNIDDLCRGVGAMLKSDKLRPGFYNMASVNTTIGNIGYQVSKRFNLRYDEAEGPDTYSYTIDSGKFEREFNFEFDSRLSAIIDSVSTIDWVKVMDEDHPDSYRRTRIP